MTQLKVLLAFCLILVNVYGFGPGFDEKFCGQNIPQSKIQEFQKCEQFVPKEILDSSAKCLQQINLGTSYTDFRKAICDSNLRKKYFQCQRNQMKQKQNNGPPPEMSEEQAQNFRKHEDCMRKAMGVKDDQ